MEKLDKKIMASGFKHDDKELKEYLRDNIYKMKKNERIGAIIAHINYNKTLQSIKEL